ncbi:MAG: hypothetical protein GC136_01880 [Alphaproteobacteria bacterium]|nr:hypothetical protein [Alphaproteobacteria bacterium]
MKLYTPDRLISYVVASDNGLAPNVTGDVCTLGVCKPLVRKAATIGHDWIIGMSIAPHESNNVIYVMQVEEKIPFSEYFNDSRFQCKKPDRDRKGDNFFQGTGDDLQIAFHNAAHYGKEEAIARDLKSPFTVAASTFWYFGANAPILPRSLQSTPVALPENRRGHRIIEDTKTIKTFARWLQQWPVGIHGPPRDI